MRRSPPPGRLRIVAGELRGRRIDVPIGESVRPTGDRVREALFDILGDRVCQARVADLYAGSGALGIEALSRGASSVVFVERDATVTVVLRRNLDALGVASRAVVVRDDVLPAARRGFPGGPVALVLADPPYGAYPGEALLAALAGPPAVEPDGRVVVERDGRTSPAVPEAGAPWHLYRTARYGRSCLDFYRFLGL